jgi:hypothetical protein
MVKALTYMLVTISMVFIFATYKISSKNGNPYICFIPLALWMLNLNYLEARPQTISMMFFIIVIYLLESSKLLYLIPIITLATANFHGGAAALIIVILAIYLMSHIFDSEKISKKYIINMLIIIALSSISLGITPYGFESVTYGTKIPIWVYDRIKEWQVAITSTESIVYLLILIVPIVCMIYLKESSLKDVLFLSMAYMLTFQHNRMILLLVPIYIIFGCKYITPVISDIFKNIKLEKSRKIPQPNIWVVCILIFALFISNIATISISKVEQASITSPWIIKNYIIENDLDVKNNIMYNDYGYGGYFIYNDIPVFVDGRTDIYLEEYGNKPIFRDWLSISDVNPNTDELIQKYNIKYWATAYGEPLYNYLVDNKKAVVLTENKTYALLETVEEAFANE